MLEWKAIRIALICRQTKIDDFARPAGHTHHRVQSTFTSSDLPSQTHAKGKFMLLPRLKQYTETLQRIERFLNSDLFSGDPYFILAPQASNPTQKDAASFRLRKIIKNDEGSVLRRMSDRFHACDYEMVWTCT
jgi:hypothetical protein